MLVFMVSTSLLCTLSVSELVCSAADAALSKILSTTVSPRTNGSQAPMPDFIEVDHVDEHAVSCPASKVAVIWKRSAQSDFRADRPR